MKIPKKVTPAKSAANKQNAQKSSGPKSVQGKRFASQNAIRHGILIRGLLLLGESSMEFEQLRKQLITDFAPVGSGEFDQVEIYLANLWRLPRVYRAEAGEITKQLCEFNPAAELATSEHTRHAQLAVASLDELKKIEEQINLQGRVSSESLDWMRTLPYGDAVKEFLQLIELVEDTEGSEEGRPGREETSAATERGKSSSAKVAAPSQEDGGLVRDVLLNALAGLENRIRQELLYHGPYPPQRVVAKQNALQVPQEAVLFRCMRYENHLLQNMYRARHDLEHMQRVRRGD